MINDSRAEAPEAAGHFRRAAKRWLDVLANCSVKEQEWVLRRRNACLVQARRRQSAVRDNLGVVGRAATARQEEMGIARPGGSAFRLSGRSKPKRADRKA